MDCQISMKTEVRMLHPEERTFTEVLRGYDTKELRFQIESVIRKAFPDEDYMGAFKAHFSLQGFSLMTEEGIISKKNGLLNVFQKGE